MGFIILFADDDRLYARNGWAGVSNRCSWVKIDEHATLGLATGGMPDGMKVKAVGERAWPEGDVDLPGRLLGLAPSSAGSEGLDYVSLGSDAWSAVITLRDGGRK